MQRLEVSGAVRPLSGSLGVKGLIISKNFHILSRFDMNEIGSFWVVFLLYLNCCSWLAWIWPVTAETCSQILPNFNYCVLFDICCVLTVHNMLYRFDNTQLDGLTQIWEISAFSWFYYKKIRTVFSYETSGINSSVTQRKNTRNLNSFLCFVLFQDSLS